MHIHPSRPLTLLSSLEGWPPQPILTNRVPMPRTSENPPAIRIPETAVPSDLGSSRFLESNYTCSKCQSCELDSTTPAGGPVIWWLLNKKAQVMGEKLMVLDFPNTTTWACIIFLPRIVNLKKIQFGQDKRAQSSVSLNKKPRLICLFCALTLALGKQCLRLRFSRNTVQDIRPQTSRMSWPHF